MRSGDDRMGALLPLGTLAAPTGSAGYHISDYLDRVGAHIAMASMGGKAWRSAQGESGGWFREQDRVGRSGATARRRRCSSPARGKGQRSSLLISSSMRPSRRFAARINSRAQTAAGSDIYGRPRTPATVLAEDVAGSEAAFAGQMTRPCGPPLRPTTPISRRSTKPSAAILLLIRGNPSAI
jgi:hypothetical protein